MALDVKVKIDLINPVGSLDWGYPLILSKGTTAVAYSVCTSIDEVIAAGFASGTDTYAAAEMMFKQNNPPAQIAVCAVTDVTPEALSAIRDYDWRQLVTVGDVEAATVASYIAATDDKMYFAGVASVGEAKTLVGTSGSNRVVCVVHSTQAELAAAAVAAVVAGRDVGSITYKNLALNGVEAETLTETEIAAIHETNCITILKKVGYVVTSEGYATNGEYADVTDCVDYIVSQITFKTQQALINNNKLPYDNRGISLLENIALDVLKTAYGKGMIAEDAEGKALYTVDYAPRSAMSASDIGSRKYTGGKFAFTLAGAIHDVDVTGEISVA